MPRSDAAAFFRTLARNADEHIAGVFHTIVSPPASSYLCIILDGRLCDREQAPYEGRAQDTRLDSIGSSMASVRADRCVLDSAVEEALERLVRISGVTSSFSGASAGGAHSILLCVRMIRFQYNFSPLLTRRPGSTSSTSTLRCACFGVERS